MKKRKIRIHVQRSIGMTSVSFEAPAEDREKAVEAAKELLAAIPESTFQGDGVAITTIPSGGPGMDGPMGFIRRVDPDA